MNEKLYDMLLNEAKAEKSKALLSIDLLSNSPSGIGDHSTKDYWDNATEALKLLASSTERIEILEKYFGSSTGLIKDSTSIA